MNLLTEKIRLAQAENRLALIPFITVGFPNPSKFWDVLSELEAQYCDIIEIGIPFSDPVADGPLIEEASRSALLEGISLTQILQGLQTHPSPEGGAARVLMGYYNPFLQYGLERFAADAKAASVSGIIVPDLPLNESEEMREALNAQGIILVPLVGLNTSLERMKEYARVSDGFVYLVSTLGTTGDAALAQQGILSMLQRAQEAFELPLALGFGLKNPDQLDFIPTKLRPSAAVFGSALMKHIAQGSSIKNFLSPWR